MSDIRVFENKSLKEFNTFSIEAKAKKYVEVSEIQHIKEVLSNPKHSKNNLLILGGGSNILFTKDFDGLVIKNNIHGIEVINEDEEKVIIKVGAGEIWHNLVLTCINRGFGGLENLSLIPGTVGAAPMQNIGAYGVEIKDSFVLLEALNLNTLEIEIFDNEACQFGYRKSIFKNTHKDKYIIVNVTFRLSKKPNLNTSYGAIQETLKNRNISAPTIRNVSEAVIAIRQSKLPDPKKLGNAGSFFKNPVVDIGKYNELKIDFPAIASYELPNNEVKIPAAWLIENCGWKGKRISDIGVHDKQALVLVNYGNGSGSELYKLALEVQKSVNKKFGIKLDMEVNVI